MTLVPANARNRINPLAVSTIEPFSAPYVSYDDVELCRDPYCSVCQAQKYDRHRKHLHKRHHHHHHHHHRKHKTNFWDELVPRVESASSTATLHNVQLDERRLYHNTPMSDRALVPVNQTERQVVSTTRTQRLVDDDVVREAWTPNRTSRMYDDEIICCRAYNGCRCPCWCCILLIILSVILLIILIVLLATLL